MIDLHTHILCDIDDGPDSLETSLTMLDKQISQGVDTVVCTPHFNPLQQDLDAFVRLRDMKMKELQKAITKSDRVIKVLKGAEVLYSSKLLEMNLNDLVIENTDYLLIELSTQSMPSNFVGQMSELLLRGYIPILAHIERYGFFRDNPQLVVDLINLGVVMQVNASSFINKVQSNFIHACIKHHWIHVIASDTHAVDRRPPILGDIMKQIREQYPKLETYLLKNSEYILQNENIEIYPPSKIKKLFSKYY